MLYVLLYIYYTSTCTLYVFLILVIYFYFPIVWFSICVITFLFSLYVQSCYDLKLIIKKIFVFQWLEFFMIYEIFYYMVFIRYYTGKIWSPICIQDIVKPGLHYQINLIRLMKVITSFLYHICLTNISDENNCLYVQNKRRIKNPVKLLKWRFLWI